jgi:hypothetical protein
VSSGWHWSVTLNGAALANSDFPLVNQGEAIDAANAWIKSAMAQANALPRE